MSLCVFWSAFDGRRRRRRNRDGDGGGSYVPGKRLVWRSCAQKTDRPISMQVGAIVAQPVRV